MTIIVSRTAARDLTMAIEDALEYWCREQAEYGTPIAGQTGWKIISAWSQAKEAEMTGEVR